MKEDIREQEYPRGGRAKIHGWKRYTAPTGEIVEGHDDFVDMYEKITNENIKKQEKWIAWLREYGVKLAHPNDGWNDRNRKIFTPAYPYFDDGVIIGDLIALGNYECFIVIKVKSITHSFFRIKKFEYMDYK